MSTLGSAIALHRRGDLRGAAAACVEILEARPDDAPALTLLGGVMRELGHPDDALALLDRAIRADRRSAPAHANRGLALRALGRLDDACEALRRAVRFDPDLTEAWEALATTEAARERWDAAETAAERASPAVLGSVKLARGDRIGAARAFATALQGAPSRALAIALCEALSPVADPPGDLGPALAIALGFDGVDHSRLDRAIRAALEPLRRDPERLLADPLLVPWLSRTVAAHPAWEQALMVARAVLLELAVVGAAPEPLLLAFALHAHATEHCWSTPPSERARLAALPADAHLARAMYQPLAGEVDGRGALAALVEVVRGRLARERALGAAVPELGGDDPSNAELRAMYEENPYPRLVSVHRREGRPFRAWLRALFPGVEAPSPVDVLVAGCGTGRHALQSALAWSDARVLAIDLSRASLGRAARLAEAYGLTNLAFARGDLLGVAALGRRFDVIEAVGVLHHLHDPRAGWRALRAQLNPGGWMRIGLYAERGRADVVAARELVALHGFRPDADGIRAARAALLAVPDDHPARPIVWSPDFYSLSGCRDLVFHVREHRTGPLGLRDDLQALDLELVGFQHALPQVAEAYRARWPDDPQQVDLARWDALEQEQPRMFSGMYVLWARAR